MVGILTSMKFAMLRHSPSALRIGGWVCGVVLVVLTWVAGSFAADDAVRSDVLMLLFVGWGVGCILGPVTMSGAGVLRAEYFSLMPIARSRLALGLLGAVFPGVASGYLLLAFLGVSAHAALRSPLTVGVGVVSAVLLWVLVIAASRVVYALLGAVMKTWLGIEISAIQFGVIIAAMFTGWIVVLQAFRTVPDLLRDGLPDAITDVLGLLPTSWPVQAVDAAADGRWGTAAGWVLALVALAGLLLTAAARMLRPDLGSSRPRAQRRSSSKGLDGRSLLPDTPLGVVVGKELRQWRRDPWRRLELRTSTYTGLLTGLFILSAPEAAPFAPLSGAICAFMISMGACNLYGQDGSAVWLSIVGQRADTARVEVRGRQLAILILFTPPIVAVSVVLVVITQAWWAVWVLLAALPSLIGLATGVAILMSAVGVSPGVDPRRRVGPNDAGGDLSLQAQVAFWGTALFFLPTAAVIVVSQLADAEWWRWVAVGFGLASGVVGYWLFGRMAIGYLETRLPTVYARIRYPGDQEAQGGGGVLDWLESSSQKSEDTAREAKEKEKRARAEARRKAAALD